MRFRVNELTLLTCGQDACIEIETRMSYLRFNQVFFGLLALSFLSAMLLPASISKYAQANVQALFAPVASPARSISAWIHRKFAPAVTRDDGSPDHPRAQAAVYAENLQLRQELVRMSAQVDRLESLESERAKLKNLREQCTPFAVLGGDAGQGSSLHLTASSFDGLSPGMAAIVPDGLVGKIDRVGTAGASIELITARNRRIGVRIGRIDNNNGKPAFFALTPATVAEGQGGNMLKTILIRQEDLKEVKINDWVVLEDREWPNALQNFRVGCVSEIIASRSTPGFAQVKIESLVNLSQLQEVMIINKDRRIAAR